VGDIVTVSPRRPNTKYVGYLIIKECKPFVDSTKVVLVRTDLSSEFWIDEFIETTWLAVTSRGGTPSSLSSWVYNSPRRERKKSKYMTLLFL